MAKKTFDYAQNRYTLQARWSGSKIIFEIDADPINSTGSAEGLSHLEWRAELRRTTSSGDGIIGLRTGYVTNRSRSYREFTNVAKRGKVYIMVRFTEPFVGGIFKNVRLNLPY